MQHVVSPAVAAGPLDRKHVQRLLDDTDQRRITVVGAAHLARIVLGDVEADRAVPKLLFDRANGRGECGRVVRRGTQDEIGQPLRRLRADAGKLSKLVDETGERTGQRGRHVMSAREYSDRR